MWNWLNIEARRFINQVESEGITLTKLEKSAITGLVSDLKKNSLWTKMTAVYPFISNNLDAYKYNLIDPQDEDDSFRLAWQSEAQLTCINGINPINGFANTFIVVGDTVLPSNMHMSYYSHEDASENSVVMGAALSGVGNTYMVINDSTKNCYTLFNSQSRVDGGVQSSTAGYYVASSVSARIRMFKNGTRIKDGAYVGAGGVATDIPIALFARNDDGTRTSPTGLKCNFVTIGLGLTDTEVLNLNTVVQRYITRLDRYDQADNDYLPITGSQTFSPAIATNSYLDKYMAFELGGLIHFSIYTFRYIFTTPANPSIFNLKKVDVDTWVSKAKNAGIKYLGLTIFDTSGFALFDNPYHYPDYLLNQTWGYRKFDVAYADADTRIVDKFFTACVKYGIEPMVYMCTVSNTAITLARAGTQHTQNNGHSAEDKIYYDNYLCKVAQYIMTTWGPKYFWLDVAGATVVTDMQTLYNAIKSIDPTCVIIGNTIGDRSFNYYPYDIGSNEEYYTLGGGNTWDNVLVSTRVHGGTTYYIPQEVVTNILSGGQGASYYWADQALRPLSELQDIYDIAKAHSVPFLLSLAPNTSGVIPDAQFNLFAGLT